MKILFLTHNYPRFQGDYSGLPFKSLIDQLIKINYKITVIAPHTGNLPLYEKSKNLEIYRFKYGIKQQIAYTGNMQKFLINPLYWNEFLSFFKFFYNEAKLHTHLFDIVHVQWLIPAGIIGKLLPAKKKIISLHGSDIRLFSKFNLNFLGKTILSDYDYVLPVSSFLKNKILKWVDNKKIKIFPFISNVDNFIYKPVVTIPEKISLISVTRLTKQKNTITLIKAIKIVTDKGFPVDCMIIGDGEEKNNLLNLVTKYKLDNTVKFTGRIDHGKIPEIIKKYPVFVLPSYEEGFGISIIEAKLAGRIILAAKSGGITDLIIDNETGYFFKTFSPENCAEKIIKIFKNKKKSIQISQNSFFTTLNTYSYKYQIKKWDKFYKKIK